MKRRFYIRQHRHTCGVDLRAENACVCILDEQGDVIYVIYPLRLAPRGRGDAGGCLNGRAFSPSWGIYRLVHFPASDHEDLVVLWLWSEQEGVFSHDTALALHDLSDILPSRVHLTLPAGWRRRRLRVPTGLVLYFADIGDGDRSSFDAVPVTRPRRTLEDCIETHVEPRLVEQAIRQARQRGLISASEETRLRGELTGVGEATAP